MAIVANTFTRYDAKGLREELSNVIYDISPDDTPVLSGASKGRARQTLFEWQTDVLRPAAANAHLEGDDITSFPAVVPTARVGNYTQISRELLILSGTLEAVDKAGRQSELAYQMSRKSLVLKHDMEKTILSNVGGDAGDTSNARKTAGLGAWVKTNVDFNAVGGDNPVYTSGVPGAARTDGTQRALTETIFKNVVSQGWVAGANIDRWIAYAGPKTKTVISGFDGIVTRNFDISNAPARPTAAIAAIDVYVTDFGTVRIKPSRLQRERDLWFIDIEYLSVRHLRPFHTVELAKTGDAEKRMLLVEWGLQVKNEAALGLAADLND